MTFVNEKGGLDRLTESQKYAELYNKATGKNESFINEQWTIDREREMLLVCVYKERQDMSEGNFEYSNWLFYWHGSWISFSQQGSLGGFLNDDHCVKKRKIINMQIPAEVQAEQLGMFGDLKEAFLVYRVSGAFGSTKEYRFDLTLDYSEVL